jgi:hypothetical protein
MYLLRILKASGTHLARCSGVPPFSCAKAVVAQNNAATAAIQGRRLVCEIMSVCFRVRSEGGAVKKPLFQRVPRSQKAEARP